MRILVVEDARRLAGIIRRGLQEDAYTVDNAYDGEEAQYMAETTPFDLIILDIMLPKKDGLTVCRGLRAKKNNTPILMLTAKDTTEDKVIGLDSGAYDYLVKPFAFSELMARIRALLRREALPKTPKLQVGNLPMDVQTREGGGGRAGELDSDFERSGLPPACNMSILKSIKFRLTVWYLIGILLLLVAFGTVAYIMLSKNLYRNLDEGLRARGAALENSTG